MIPTVQRRWFFVPAMILMLAACSEPPAGSGSIDGYDLGLKTELHLKDLQHAYRPSADALERARQLFESGPVGLDSLRSYTARAEVDEDEGEIGLQVWLMPLGAEGDGHVVLALDDDGVVRRSRIWGSTDLDQDPEAAWENFWRQFEYEGSRKSIPASDRLSGSDVDSVWTALQADTSGDAATARLLYEHRLIMYDNSFVLRRTMATARGTNVPPVDWLEANRDKYRRLEEMGAALRPIIGDSASHKYVGVAQEAGEILELAVAHARASEGDKVRDRVLTFRRRACGGCHGIENHDAGDGKLKDDVFALLDDYGVRRDLYSVGRDVWGVPGEGERSQSIADAVKAMLVIAGAR